jgi:hypothetical protein
MLARKSALVRRRISWSLACPARRPIWIGGRGYRDIREHGGGFVRWVRFRRFNWFGFFGLGLENGLVR